MHQSQAQEVNTKDFPSLAQGKALPYGVYDSGQNRAVVNVGVNHDTAEAVVFLLNSLDGLRLPECGGPAKLICLSSL